MTQKEFELFDLIARENLDSSEWNIEKEHKHANEYTGKLLDEVVILPPHIAVWCYGEGCMFEDSLRLCSEAPIKLYLDEHGDGEPFVAIFPIELTD